MQHPFFGKRLAFDVQTIRSALGNDLEGLAQIAGVKLEILTRLQSGEWAELTQDQLFYVACLAQMVGSTAGVVHAESNPLWATFRASDADNVIVVGASVRGVDLELAAEIENSDFPHSEFWQIREGEEPALRNALSSRNVVLIGGPRVNIGARVALAEICGGDRIVRFHHPLVAEATQVTIPSVSGEKAIEIDGALYSENQAAGTRVGVVIARRALPGNKDVTTVIIGGASKEATQAMVGELSRPAFNRLYDQSWATSHRGRRITFLFDTSVAGRWKVLDADKPARGPGRPRKLRR